MSVQRQVKLIGIVPSCLCNRQPKAYCTDFTEYHLECNHCAIFTVRLSNLQSAKMEFARLLRVVREDKQKQEATLLGVVK